MTRWLPLIAVLLIAAGALVLRVPKLTLRPMHNDEAVNTVKFKELYETGRFEYDPHEYHGPTLYYVTVPFVWLSGAKTFAQSTETPYRLVLVVFGVGLVLLTLALRKELGPLGVIFAALFTAASPALTFYSRYYIHETLLVFLTFAAVVCGWRLYETRKIGWAIATGAAIGLMWATKETWVIPMTAAGGAILLTWVWNRVRPLEHPLPVIQAQETAAVVKPPLSWLSLGAVAFLSFALITALLFTSFFTRPKGIVDAVLAYKIYFARGTGNTDHLGPFGWYLKLLTWFQQPVGPTAKVNRNPIFTEIAIVALAAAGFFFALIRCRSANASLGFARFVAFYTVLLTLIYSRIPYKTPWCALGFLHGMILLAGFGVAQLIRVTPTIPGKLLAGIVMLLPAADLARQSYVANYRFYADDRRNPWVYAHTSGDIETLVYRMNEVAKVSPDHEKVYVQVVTKDCWPIPWYLRRFEKVGYWPDPAAPPALDADVIIGPLETADRLPTSSTGQPLYSASSFGLRRGYVLWIFIKRPLWQRLQEYWETKPGPAPRR